MLVGQVEPWVQQHLQGGRRAVVGSGHARDPGRQVAAGAVSADADPRGVGAELARVRDREPERSDRVIKRRRKPVLRREPVVDRQHPDAGMVCDEAARVVMGLKIADDEPTAVVEDQERIAALVRLRRAGPVGHVQARCDLSRRAVDHQFLDADAVEPAPLRDGLPVSDHRAHLGHRHRVAIRRVGEREQLQP